MEVGASHGVPILCEQRGLLTSAITGCSCCNDGTSDIAIYSGGAWAAKSGVNPYGSISQGVGVGAQGDVSSPGEDRLAHAGGGAGGLPQQRKQKPYEERMIDAWRTQNTDYGRYWPGTSSSERRMLVESP